MSSEYVNVITGDARSALEQLPQEHFHVAVTSPPYWTLRDYGATTGTHWPEVSYRPTPGSRELVEVKPWDGQLGQEPDTESYIGHLVYVFQALWSVLRHDSSAWLVLGDTYLSARQGAAQKAKDMAGLPWRVALALQATGWWLRSDVIWHKPNAMPSSATDRPGRDHEYVFLLTKAARYYFDLVAELQPYRSAPRARRGNTGMRGQSLLSPRSERRADDPGRYWGQGGTNPRTVWSINTMPNGSNHLATYPLELARRCISLSTSQEGCCSTCGSPLERQLIRERQLDGEPLVGGWGETSGRSNFGPRGAGHERIRTARKTTGWQAPCECDTDNEPCRVLDPFSGVGTTGAAALGLGRHYTGIELNPEYANLQKQRLLEHIPLQFAAKGV